MPEIDVKVTPFIGCKFLYQSIAKLCEETGEVAQAFYYADTKDPADLSKDDIAIFVEECGDVIQAAINIIYRCGFDLQDVMDSVTEKNVLRGYYNAE
jgi:NTP pyrophosphatase (non-canonical NTP hydrolase)